MKIQHNQWLWRPAALVTSASLLVPTLAGCGGQPQSAPTGGGGAIPAPRMAAPGERPGAPRPAAGGMSTRNKVLLLGGAAAAYYLWRKHQAKMATQKQNVQYYLSKNGGIYYRDPNNKMQPVFVTQPTNQLRPVSVPEDELSASAFGDIRNVQGYPGATGGNDLGHYFTGAGGLATR